MNFAAGGDWSERGDGTNAPGTALSLDCEVQIRGAEHYRHAAREWSCSAVPIHDLAGAQIGALDLTGGSVAASAQVLAPLRATAVAISGHIALQGRRRSVPNHS